MDEEIAGLYQRPVGADSPTGSSSDLHTASFEQLPHMSCMSVHVPD